MKAGQFGDSLALISSAFSALTLSGLLFSIILQRKELHDTRQELFESKKEFAKQYKILDDQSKAMELQNNTVRKRHLNQHFSNY